MDQDAKSPYADLPDRQFWRSGVTESHPLTVTDLYRKKFPLHRSDKIATAGSCFAQHVTNYLRANGFFVMDVEPAPLVLSAEVAKSFGFGIYSARYGNIYTVRQLLQLAQDAESGFVDEQAIWTKNGKFYDALRPGIEPDGLKSVEEAVALRKFHLAKVKQLFKKMKVFIFTLGLTEAWIDARSGRVFPTAPGTIAGSYDPAIHTFENFGFKEIYRDFVAFDRLVRSWNPRVKMILTVSPVPLTATAADQHVLVATTYSKSVLRSVAGALADKFSHIDYFPSYEIIASAWSKGAFYESNMRSVTEAGVAAVMRVFFSQHGGESEEEQIGRRAQRRLRKADRERAKQNAPERPARRQRSGLNDGATDAATSKEGDVICEEVLLEAFGR